MKVRVAVVRAVKHQQRSWLHEPVGKDCSSCRYDYSGYCHGRHPYGMICCCGPDHDEVSMMKCCHGIARSRHSAAHDHDPVIPYRADFGFGLGLRFRVV